MKGEGSAWGCYSCNLYRLGKQNIRNVFIPRFHNKFHQQNLIYLFDVLLWTTGSQWEETNDAEFCMAMEVYGIAQPLHQTVQSYQMQFTSEIELNFIEVWNLL